MTFDPVLYRPTTRQQWEDYAQGWSAWSPFLETWLGAATERMLDLAAIAPEDRNAVWREIESALGRYQTGDGFVGPCELVAAGATR